MKCTDMYRDIACVHKAAAILSRPRLYEDAKLEAWKRVREAALAKNPNSPLVKSGMAMYAMPDSEEAGIERVTKRLQEERLLRREGDMLIPTEAGKAWKEGYDKWRDGGSKYPPGKGPQAVERKERPVSARRSVDSRLDKGVDAAREKAVARLLNSGLYRGMPPEEAERLARLKVMGAG